MQGKCMCKGTVARKNMALLTWQIVQNGKNKACVCTLSVWGRRDKKLRQRMKDGDEAGMEKKDQIMKGFECHALEIEFSK